jgi:phage repressor protein C with HTH and peptisase S24 domain
MISVDRSANVAAMNTMGERLRAAREAKYRSAAKAAVALGINASTYRAHENGQNEFNPEEAERYGRKFGVTAAYLLTGDGTPPKPKLINSFDPDNESDESDDTPTIGRETGARGIPPDASAQVDVTAGLGAGGLTMTADGVPGRHGLTFSADVIRDYWRLPPVLLGALGMRAHDVTVVMVQGDSMHPTLNEGDFVFVDTRHRVPSPDGIYALSDAFGGIVVKRLEVTGGPDEDDMRLHVISDNPRHPPKSQSLGETNIIGRVLRKFGVVG